MTKKPTVTREQVEAYQQVVTQLKSLSEEMAVLSKKSPDAPLNKFKVSIVNERLDAASKLLTGMHKPFKDFERLDDAQLPTVSDVAVVLSQFLTSLEGWRSANVVKNGVADWVWNTAKGEYQASRPTRFRQGDD